MKRQLIIFLAVSVSLAIGLYFFFTANDNNQTDKEARNFAFKQTQSLDKIFLADKSGVKVTLTKEGDIWRVNNNYVARAQRIETLLNTIQNIQVKQRVPKAKQERILKNLATSNIKLELYSKEELVKSYYIGSADGATTGTYSLLIDEDSGENYPTPYLTHLPGFEGYLTPRFEPSPATWRDLKIFYFPKNAIKSVELEYPDSPQNDFTIQLNDNQYELIQNGKVISSQATQIKQYLLGFKSISAEGLISEKGKEKIQKEISNQKPWFTLKVTNLRGNSTSIIGYKKVMPEGSTNAIGLPMFFDPDRFYGICFENEIASLQHFVFEPLLIKAADLK